MLSRVRELLKIINTRPNGQHHKNGISVFIFQIISNDRPPRSDNDHHDKIEATFFPWGLL